MALKERRSAMLLPADTMGPLATGLLWAGCARGQGEHLHGLRYALTTMVTIVPLLVLAFITAGMVKALLPQAMLAH